MYFTFTNVFFILKELKVLLTIFICCLVLTHFFGSLCVACLTHDCVHLWVRWLFLPVSPRSCIPASPCARSDMGTGGETTKPLNDTARGSPSYCVEVLGPLLHPKARCPPRSAPSPSLRLIC